VLAFCAAAWYSLFTMFGWRVPACLVVLGPDRLATAPDARIGKLAYRAGSTDRRGEEACSSAAR